MGDSNSNNRDSYLEYSIDRMITVIDQLVKQLSRTVILQLIFIAISFTILLEPEFMPTEQGFGWLPYQLANYCIPFIFLKLYFDWGYKSYHYLSVRDNLEKCLDKFYPEYNDNPLSKEDFVQIFIPTSAFTTFFGTNSGKGGSLLFDKKNQRIQYFFVICLILSLAVSNFLALYFLEKFFVESLKYLFFTLFAISYVVAYSHYYGTIKHVEHYQFLLFIIVLTHVVVNIVGFIAMPKLEAMGPFLF